MARPELKKHWAPNEPAFRRFLEWLDEGVDSGGEGYLEMRRRIELYFERRNCRASDELADDTLNRVARRLEEEGTIRAASPAHYCYIVAKLVFHEYVRKSKAISEVPADDLVMHQIEPAVSEQIFERLEHCLQKLPAGDRELIIEYYRGEQQAKIERRRAIAEKLGLSMNALSIRACRVREKLEACIKEQIGEN